MVIYFKIKNGAYGNLRKAYKGAIYGMDNSKRSYYPYNSENTLQEQLLKIKGEYGQQFDSFLGII